MTTKEDERTNQPVSQRMSQRMKTVMTCLTKKNKKQQKGMKCMTNEGEREKERERSKERVTDTTSSSSPSTDDHDPLSLSLSLLFPSLTIIWVSDAFLQNLLLVFLSLGFLFCYCIINSFPPETDPNDNVIDMFMLLYLSLVMFFVLYNKLFLSFREEEKINVVVQEDEGSIERNFTRIETMKRPWREYQGFSSSNCILLLPLASNAIIFYLSVGLLLSLKTSIAIQIYCWERKMWWWVMMIQIKAYNFCQWKAWFSICHLFHSFIRHSCCIALNSEPDQNEENVFLNKKNDPGIIITSFYTRFWTHP